MAKTTPETAEERSAKFIADIESIDRMTTEECRAELRRMARLTPSVVAAAAVASLASDMVRRDRQFDGKSRNWCGKCPFMGIGRHGNPIGAGCVVCEL